MKIKKSIKELAKIERPRERLMKYGVEALSNSELLAIMLRTGRPNENVLELAQRVLKTIGGKNLPQASFDKLKSITGLGPVKACEILASFELSQRLLNDKKAKIFLTAKDIFHALRDVRSNKKEHFVVFYLDVRNQEIKREIITVGLMNEAVVHPREVFEGAIRNAAFQIIVAHNHSVDDVEPTDADLRITKDLLAAARILGIKIIDHIIVSKTKYFSVKDNTDLKEEFKKLIYYYDEKKIKN